METDDLIQELGRFRNHCEETEQLEVAELAHDAKCRIEYLSTRLQRAEELLSRWSASWHDGADPDGDLIDETNEYWGSHGN